MYKHIRSLVTSYLYSVGLLQLFLTDGTSAATITIATRGLICRECVWLVKIGVRREVALTVYLFVDGRITPMCGVSAGLVIGSSRLVL